MPNPIAPVLTGSGRADLLQNGSKLRGWPCIRATPQAAPRVMWRLAASLGNSLPKRQALDAACY
jgi:hypothetical protein